MTVTAYFFGILIITLLALFVVIVGPLALNFVLERPSGILREWHQTMTTIPADTSSPSSQELWDAAISVLDRADGKLIREWNSPYSFGEGVYREYRLNDTDVLIEVDRRNGFTISGKSTVAEPLAQQIQREVQLSR